MGSGIDPKVDYAFKRVFGSDENCNVLRHMLNAYLKESLPRPIAELSLLNPFCLTDAATDKLSILDIKARDESGREYIIEVQLFPHASFPERLLYYGAKEYSGQLQKGEDYSQLRPVIVVCFVNAVLFKHAADYHSRFELVDVRQQVQFTDQLQIHVIELPKFLRTINELKSDDDFWTYFLQHGQDWDNGTLPATLAQVPEIRQATGTLTMVSQTPDERVRYEAQLKFTRDERARLQYVLQEAERMVAEAAPRIVAEAAPRIVAEAAPRIRAEGQAEHARELIQRFGRKRLGEPPAEVVTRLMGISDIQELDELTSRILECPSWDVLLQSGSK